MEPTAPISFAQAVENYLQALVDRALMQTLGHWESIGPPDVMARHMRETALHLLRVEHLRPPASPLDGHARAFMQVIEQYGEQLGVADSVFARFILDFHRRRWPPGSADLAREAEIRWPRGLER